MSHAGWNICVFYEQNYTLPVSKQPFIHVGQTELKTDEQPFSSKLLGPSAGLENGCIVG